MKTKVFISWSGKNTESFKFAKKLAEWLPNVLQNTEPFMSDNIRAGTNPIKQIMDNLASSKVGIICVTKDNIDSTWLNFEAGALNNVVTTNKGVVIPILIDMTTDEFYKCSSPINTLQGKVLDSDGIKQMLISINDCLEAPLKERQIDDIYDKWISSILDDTSRYAIPDLHANFKVFDDFEEFHDIEEVDKLKNIEDYEELLSIFEGRD